MAESNHVSYLSGLCGSGARIGQGGDDSFLSPVMSAGMGTAQTASLFVCQHGWGGWAWPGHDVSLCLSVATPRGLSGKSLQRGQSYFVRGGSGSSITRAELSHLPETQARDWHSISPDAFYCFRRVPVPVRHSVTGRSPNKLLNGAWWLLGRLGRPAAPSPCPLMKTVLENQPASQCLTYTETFSRLFHGELH